MKFSHHNTEHVRGLRLRAPQGCSGITRREVIVGVTVLLVLLGMIFPWFLGQKKRGLEAGSLQNLQQWGIALNLYLIENQSTLPSVGTKPPAAEDTTAWFNALPTYLMLPQLAQLPPEQQPRPGKKSLWIDPFDAAEPALPADAFYFSYGMNRWLQPVPDYRPYKIHEIENPAATVFLAEVSGDSPGALPAQVVFRRGRVTTGPEAHTAVLFCDGHVGLQTKASLVDTPAAVDPTLSRQDPTWVPRVNAARPEN